MQNPTPVKELLAQKTPIVLCGLPGAGKTTLGKYLAALLDLPFADSDQLIVQREQKSIAEIFSSRGEVYFRKVEAEVIAEVLNDFPGILALGGGALQAESTQELLKKHLVVYLNIALPQLYNRLLQDHSRPLLADKDILLEKLNTLAQTRCETYRQIARWEIPVGELPLADQARKLLTILGLTITEPADRPVVTPAIQTSELEVSGGEETLKKKTLPAENLSEIEKH